MIEDARPLPGPPARFFLGNLREIAPQATRMQTVQAWRQQYGDVFRVMMGRRMMVMLADPVAIQRVLLDNAKNYPKSDQYEKLKPLLGEGLLTSKGDVWLRQRRMMQPYFHHKHVAGLMPPMVRCVSDMLARWEVSADAGERVDVAAEMMALTLRIVGMTLLGTDVAAESTKVGAAMTEALEGANRAFFAPVTLPAWWPSAGHRRFRAAKATLDGVVLGIIHEKRQAGPKPAEVPTDMLDMLIGATDDETGIGMTDLQLRDEVMTIFLAGHETTAAALTWTMFLLSRHPDVARRVRAEVVAVLGDRVPTMADLGQLTYTGKVIDEAMRLYPPIVVIQRQAIADDVLGGYHVPAGTAVTISIYALHHHAGHWPNPEGFDPDREPAAHRYAYLPFAGGSRICIGMNFALMEAKLALALIVRAFRADLVPGQPVVPKPAVTMRPAHGLLMTLHRQPGV